MSNELDTDLNATITAAIQAKVTASVAAALSGDEVMGQYVAAALNQKVDVSRGQYVRKSETTFISSIVSKSIQAATEVAVKDYLAEHNAELIELVRKALRRQAPEIAEAMVGQVVEKASQTYGVKVSLRFPGD